MCKTAGISRKGRKAGMQDKWDDFSSRLPHAWRYAMARRHKLMDEGAISERFSDLLKKLKLRDDLAGFLSL